MTEPIVQLDGRTFRAVPAGMIDPTETVFQEINELDLPDVAAQPVDGGPDLFGQQLAALRDGPVLVDTTGRRVDDTDLQAYVQARTEAAGAPPTSNQGLPQTVGHTTVDMVLQPPDWSPPDVPGQIRTEAEAFAAATAHQTRIEKARGASARAADRISITDVALDLSNAAVRAGAALTDMAADLRGAAERADITGTGLRLAVDRFRASIPTSDQADTGDNR